MPEADPYKWSSSDTVDFLQQNQFGSLAQQWSTNDLNGQILLEDVNIAFLRDELGIDGLKERILIMQMIRALRKSSVAYAESLGSSTLPPASLPPIPHLFGSHISTEPVGSRVRKGEELVEDSGGRKRRRLNLDTTHNDAQPGASESPVITTQPTIQHTSDSTARSTPLAVGFLRPKKHTVDEIFYGDTAYGSELKHTETEDDDSYDNFTIFGKPEFWGNASFVYRRLQHAFQHLDPQSITYHRNPALSVYPYPESLLAHQDTRSVTIFESSESGIKVIREKAQMLAFQQHDVVDTQMSPGEYGYLLDKYAESDELLPTYGDSEHDSDSADEQNADHEDSDSGSDDDMAEEDLAVETPSLSRELVVSLIDKTIELQAQAWRDNQQPKLDKKEARRVWRISKGSSKTARKLTQEAVKRIERLNTRLERLKNNLMDRTWEEEQEVKQACVTLEPTVNDREHEEWKTRIWALKIEPAGTPRSSKPSDRDRHGPSKRALDQGASDEDMQDFIVNDENFEDARESQDDHDSEPDYDMQDSPSRSGLRIGTRTSDQDNQDLTTLVDGNLPDATDFEHKTSRGGSVGSESPHQLAKNETMQTPQKNILTAGLELEQESPGMPTVAQLFQSIPSTARRNRTVIEITSSPVRPTAAHITTQPVPLQSLDVDQEQGRHITYSENPDNDSLAQIRSWTFEGLEEEQDRRRILIKIASMLRNDKLEALARLFTGNMAKFFQNIRAAISAIYKRKGVFDGFDETDIEALRDAAKLYLCFLHIDHRIFESDISEFASFGYEWPWAGYEDSYADDLRAWHAHAWSALKRFRKTPMPKDLEVIDLSEDGPIENERSGHSSVRKRKVNRDQDAVRKRAKAAERAANYESQQQYSQTGSFMAGEEGVNEVPLYAPDDVDPSKYVYLNPDIAKRLKPHQIEGVKFMWRELTAPEDEDGQGCLLAHTMGLGKTAQSLALLTAIAETAKNMDKRAVLPDDLRRAKNKLRALILCPPSLMSNWKQEIATCLSSEVSAKTLRIDELKSWRHLGGIMLCGYNMFTRLINRQGSKKEAFSEEEQKLVTKILLQKPHLVIADEVHSIKNDSSKTSLAVHKIKTLRRIGLTGSPMSNNTAEIFALIDWVAPKFLGSKVEFKADYQEPIEAGTYIDSTGYEVRRSLKKLAALKEIISPKLNRADITVLKGSLKSKVEFVLTVQLTGVQKLGYETYVKEILHSKAGEEGTTITQVKLFGWLSILQLLCNHPIVFRRKLLEPPTINKKGKRTTLDATETEALPSSSAADAPTERPSTAGPSLTSASMISASATSSTAAQITGTAHMPDDSSMGGDDAAYADAHISQYDINKAIVEALLKVVPDDDSIELSHKTLLVQKIMRLSIEAGDKVLIFSQSIPSLNFLDRMLSSMGARYGRIQGDVAQDKRERVLKSMADGKLDVLLVSTRAGGLGLNIQQANRVIIFDFAFNPTWEEQAIGRAYRLGQNKPVFVYRFVAGGTFEFALYDKQLFKTGLSSRVVDKKNPMRNAIKKPGDWLKPPFDVVQQDISAEIGKDEHVMDNIIASQHGGQDEFIRSIKTMETLMGESKDEALTAEEMQEVELEVLRAKTRKLTGVPESRATVVPPQLGPGSNGFLLPEAGAPSTVPRAELTNPISSPPTPSRRLISKY
ncbi:hypothetical protein E4T49_04539 [Aureobasidium sp. EXF-10728]|nr:hypothetical protein E4T49_04539 [Aureobasidium sp. EXF-10728]